MRVIFLDIETTGLDPLRHGVLDIAFKIVDVTTGELLKAWQTLVKQSQEVWDAHDHSSIQINELTFEQILTGKEPSQVTEEILAIFQKLQIERGKAVFLCQNPSFDRGFFSQLVNVYTQEKLKWPYHWLDLASMYWMMLVQKYKEEGIPFPEQLSLSKNEIAKFHLLPPEGIPHRAMQGVDHLIQCYQVLLGVKFHGDGDI